MLNVTFDREILITQQMMAFDDPAALDMSSLDTVILDMDGTLLDLRFDDFVWNQRLPQRYAQAHGMPLPEASAKIQMLMAPIRGTLPWYCFDNWQEMTGIDLTEIEDEVYEYVRPRPGAVEFLRQLKRTHAKIVLATNADRRSMGRKINHTNLAKYFDHIISSHDFGYAKEEQGFWSAFHEKVSFRPAQSLFIDDNHCVLAAAKEFGVRFLFGIAQPATDGETKFSDEFHCLESFHEFRFSEQSRA